MSSQQELDKKKTKLIIEHGAHGLAQLVIDLSAECEMLTESNKALAARVERLEELDNG